mmetsp:Transcript_18865/g.71919  ORF Transcript_18865/g.71919 Transcript_18865/m.71919 type:complete len:256 (+) Transcript_18865:807-1574(+)
MSCATLRSSLSHSTRKESDRRAAASATTSIRRRSSGVSSVRRSSLAAGSASPASTGAAFAAPAGERARGRRAEMTAPTAASTPHSTVTSLALTACAMASHCVGPPATPGCLPATKSSLAPGRPSAGTAARHTAGAPAPGWQATTRFMSSAEPKPVRAATSDARAATEADRGGASSSTRSTSSGGSGMPEAEAAGSKKGFTGGGGRAKAARGLLRRTCTPKRRWWPSISRFPASVACVLILAMERQARRAARRRGG